MVGAGLPGKPASEETHRKVLSQRGDLLVKNPPANARSLGQEDPLDEGIATHSSILAWRIPWIEETGGLQPMGSQRVGHD